MTHVSEGRLRRLADEPAAISDPERLHVAGCSHCQALTSAAVADRDRAADVLSSNAGDGATAGMSEGAGAALDVDAAWAAIQDRLERGAGEAPVRPLATHRPRRRRRLVAVAVGAAAVVAFAGTAAASDWLPIFRPQRVEAVSFDVASMATLPDLSSYGTVSAPGDWELTPTAGKADAEARSGIDAPAVASLPQGVTGAPEYSVVPVRSVTFTFSADRAAAAATRAGETQPPMPAGVDGSKLRLEIGPGVVETWQRSSGPPVLLVARLKAPVVSSSGVALATLKQYLLAQPGIPAALAAQIRTLPDDGSTLPVPVPTDVATSKPVTVNGAPATLIQLRDQSASGVVWVSGETLTVVAGSLSADDALDVARGVA